MGNCICRTITAKHSMWNRPTDRRQRLATPAEVFWRYNRAPHSTLISSISKQFYGRALLRLCARERLRSFGDAASASAIIVTGNICREAWRRLRGAQSSGERLLPACGTGESSVNGLVTGERRACSHANDGHKILGGDLGCVNCTAVLLFRIRWHHENTHKPRNGHTRFIM